MKDGAHVSEYHGRSFKLAVSQEGFSYLFLFVAPTNQEKEAWVTDIGQVGYSVIYFHLLRAHWPKGSCVGLCREFYV